MNRGDLLTVAIPGDYGKPRPAIVVQNDAVLSDITIVCLLSSDPSAGASYRQFVLPTPMNGLREPSFVMTEKIQLARRDKCGPVIGRLSDDDLSELNANLAFVIGVGD